MLAFVYDTETTGIPEYKEPSESPQQPHIVQVCGLLVDLSGDLFSAPPAVLASLDLIVRPDGWEIPPEVESLHGIGTAHASRVGIPEDLVVDAVCALARRAEFRIGFNESFDQRIVRIAIKRGLEDEALAEEWKDQAAFCAMRGAQKALGGRNPSLRDAYRQMLGADMQGEHTARGDAMATLELYLALHKRGLGFTARAIDAADVVGAG
ncbi:MAG: 3'-5' exonuclease [Elusimicrobiales bacterium]